MQDETRVEVVQGDEQRVREFVKWLSDARGLRELELLYNHKPDDSAQFTRWQMVTAIAHGARLALAFATPPAGERKPIPMILYCPECHQQHIDEPDERTPDWDNPPHRSHLCHGCGCIWRPADVATEGVRSIKTAGDADTWGWDGASTALSLPHQADREAIAGIATQDDRDAAGDLWTSLFPNRSSEALLMREGNVDDGLIVQAFVRHRPNSSFSLDREEIAQEVVAIIRCGSTFSAQAREEMALAIIDHLIALALSPIPSAGRDGSGA